MDDIEQKLKSDVKRLLEYARSGHKYIIDAMYSF